MGMGKSVVDLLCFQCFQFGNPLTELHQFMYELLFCLIFVFHLDYLAKCYPILIGYFRFYPNTIKYQTSAYPKVEMIL